MTPDVQAFRDPATDAVSYLVADPATGAAVIIDPVLNFDPVRGMVSHRAADEIEAAVSARGLSVKWILETHAHADHLTAADHLRKHTGAPVATGALVTGIQKRFAATLYRSIRRILELPPQTRVFTCHAYPAEGRTASLWETTVEDQAAHNIHIHRGIDEATFVVQRQARDKTLPPPGLIWPALQVNIRAGALPPATAGGRVYFRIPIHIH